MRQFRYIIFLMLVFIGITPVPGQQHLSSTFRTQSWFGFSGLMFIPTAQLSQPQEWMISYGSKPESGENAMQWPFSIRLGYTPKKPGLELTLTNTPIYASKREFEGVKIRQGWSGAEMIIPIYPAVKYQFMPMIKDNYHVAMAVGFALPYGAYYVVDKFFGLKFLDVTIHTGVATKLTTYHAFAGMTFTFGKRIGEIHRDFPLEMILESCWGGSLKQLNEKEESFASISFRYAWTRSLFILTFLRIDGQPLIEKEVEISGSPTKRMGIGLDLVWR